MSVMILVQARMGSSRMPGKVLMQLAGRTLLEWVINRCRSSQRADGVGIVTTTKTDDDAIVLAAARLGVPVYRGSAEDVLERYRGAAKEWGLEAVVRVTADCPFIDPEVIDAVIEAWSDNRVDHIAVEGHVEGLGSVELLTVVALDRLVDATHDHDPRHREHVSTFLREHPDGYTTAHWQGPFGREMAGMKFSVDTPLDLAFSVDVAQHFAPRRDFTTDELVTWARDQQDTVWRVKVFSESGHARGMGHRVRCAALVKAISARVRCIVSDDGPMTECDIAIVDAPGMDGDRLLEIRASSRVLVLIEDQPSGVRVPVDVHLIPNLLHGEGEALLLDPDYDDIAPVPVRDIVLTVFACFGGSDPAGISARMEALAAELGREVVVRLALGPLCRVEAESRENLVVIRGAGSLAAELAQCDMALVSGGTLMYEACALGRPTVVIGQNAEQDDEARLFEARGFIQYLGTHDALTDSQLHSAISTLVPDRQTRKALAERAGKGVRAGGARRAADRIIEAAS